MRGVFVILGKELEEVKTSYKESLRLLARDSKKKIYGASRLYFGNGTKGLIDIQEKMSKRTVQRSIFEVGVAADIQLDYEMAKTDSKNLILIMQNLELIPLIKRDII